MPRRIFLDFRKGKYVNKFLWVSFLNNRVVGLCNNKRCSRRCVAKLPSDFVGGTLEVDLSDELISASSHNKYYLAHLVAKFDNNPLALEMPSIPESQGDYALETDMHGVTAFVYKDAKTGRSIMVDCGASPKANGGGSLAIKRLIAQNDMAGIVISHGHVDHWNGLPSNFVLPVYMTELTASYIHKKDEYLGAESRRMMDDKVFFPREGMITLDPFIFGAIPIPHSIPESCMILGIGSSDKLFLHQGDGKTHGLYWQEEIILKNNLARLGNAGQVEVMHVDNLNCHRSGFTPEESGVCRSIAEIIAANYKKRIIIAVFASNLWRIKEIARIAQKLNRSVRFVGAGMRFARDLLANEGTVFPSTDSTEPNQVVFVSGCQAEPGSVLMREAEGGDNSFLRINENDLVILSSHKIPGNEQGIKKMVTELLDGKGCQIILNHGEVKALGIESDRVSEAFTHVSGHGHREDVVTILRLVKPRAVIPSIRSGKQMEAIREICQELSIALLDPSENCFVL